MITLSPRSAASRAFRNDRWKSVILVFIIRLSDRLGWVAREKRPKRGLHFLIRADFAAAPKKTDSNPESGFVVMIMLTILRAEGFTSLKTRPSLLASARALRPGYFAPTASAGFVSVAFSPGS